MALAGVPAGVLGAAAVIPAATSALQSEGPHGVYAALAERAVYPPIFFDGYPISLDGIRRPSGHFYRAAQQLRAGKIDNWVLLDRLDLRAVKPK